MKVRTHILATLFQFVARFVVFAAIGTLTAFIIFTISEEIISWSRK